MSKITDRISIPEKIIIVGGLPRTGKTLLRNALGSHSQIAFTPSGLNFFQWCSEVMFQARGGFEENLNYFFDKDWKSKSWNITKDMVSYTGTDRRDLFLVILETYRQTYFPEKKYIGTYIHVSEEYFDTLLGWFGRERLKFIQIIRNPYDNYASHVRARKISEEERAPDKYSSSVHRFCHMWGQSSSIATYLGLKYPDTYRTLFFEDLLSNHEEAFEALCKWINVPIEVDRMLNMGDFARKQNSAFEIKNVDNTPGSVQSDNIDRRQYLNSYEIEAIQAIACANLLNVMDYEKQNVIINYKIPKNDIVPAKYALDLHMMVKSYLSPLYIRQALHVYLKHLLDSAKDILFLLFYLQKRAFHKMLEKFKW